jgi:hypothetical protein
MILSTKKRDAVIRDIKKIPSSNSKLALWMMIHQSKVIIREE